MVWKQSCNAASEETVFFLSSRICWERIFWFLLVSMQVSVWVSLTQIRTHANTRNHTLTLTHTHAAVQHSHLQECTTFADCRVWIWYISCETSFGISCLAVISAQSHVHGLVFLIATFRPCPHWTRRAKQQATGSGRWNCIHIVHNDVMQILGL